MSRYAFYGICLQLCIGGVLLANGGSAQHLKLQEIFVELSDPPKTVGGFLKVLEQETGFHFAYRQQDVDLQQGVELAPGRYSLLSLLTGLSESTGLGFKRINGSIYIQQRWLLTPEPQVTEEILAPVQVRISGLVTSADDGQPLPGVSIVVKGTTTGTTTDMNGAFSLTAPEGAVLQFSYIGYKTQEVTVGTQAELRISLQPDMEQLEEVVVVGYGTVKKSDLTGAVANVDGEELANLPSPRIDQLLQGRMAGVNITSQSGAPGAQTSIRIRGGNSISGDNEPLFVIDGFAVGTNFDLNSINVSDIKSIDVLKDASSVSIYGTRGANGVILITTKNGKGVEGGKPSISVNAYAGTQQMLREIDFLDGPERLDWARDFVKYTFSLPSTLNGMTGNTDWQQVLTQTAPIASTDVSISGNSKNVNYYFSANYFDQQGIIKNTGLQKYTIRNNLDFKYNDKISLGSRINLTMRDQDNETVAFGDLNGQLTRALPIYPRFDQNGNYWSQGLGLLFDNPEALVDLNTNQTLNTNLLANFYVEVEPIKDLKIRSTIGFSNIWNKQNRFWSRRNTTRANTNLLGRARIDNARRFEVLQENTISYNKQINKNHTINLLGGFTWQTSDQEAFYAQTDGIANDGIAFDNLSFGSQRTNRMGSEFVDPFQLVSYIGRVNYNLMDKYLFTFSGRVDGSSRFAGSNNQYAFFPSAAFAWRLKDEPFLANVEAISDVKLRASYGISGSQAIDAFATQARYQSEGYYIILNDNVASAVIRETPQNPGLKWETTAQFDMGLEMGLLNNRLSFELDYYHKRTSDLLIKLPLAGQAGFSQPVFQNVGALQNQGIELLVNSYNIDSEHFKWTTTLTLSGNRSKVLDLGGVEELVVYNSGLTGPTVVLEEAQPVGVFRGVPYLGTWRDQAQIDASGYKGNDAVPGGPKYADVNGDGVITPLDYGVIGNPEPTLFGGIQNTFTYKNLTLDILFQGTYGNDIYNEMAIFGFFGLEDRNIYQEGVNRWTPENPDSRIPGAGAVRTASEVQSNSELVEDGSHLRLKNVMLTYQFNTANIKWLNNLSVYVAGSNLWLLSSFRGYDPESRSSVAGTNNTNPYAEVVRGLVRAEYPSARMFTAGLNAKF